MSMKYNVISVDAPSKINGRWHATLKNERVEIIIKAEDYKPLKRAIKEIAGSLPVKKSAQQSFKDMLKAAIEGYKS